MYAFKGEHMEERLMEERLKRQIAALKENLAFYAERGILIARQWELEAAIYRLSAEETLWKKNMVGQSAHPVEGYKGGFMDAEKQTG